MKKRKTILKLIFPLMLALTMASCTGSDTVSPEPVKKDSAVTNDKVTVNDTDTDTDAATETENIISENNSNTEETKDEIPADTEASAESSIQNSEETSKSDPIPVSQSKTVEDNIWAAFLVSPYLSAYENRDQGDAILKILSKDSVIGDTAALSAAAPPPPDITAYGTEVITAGGPVDYSMLAYGKLSEVPDSFLNAMVEDMRNELGDSYGGHSSGAGMGYRTFYQASYDAATGSLQANQENGYWARTLGAFSEHCAGVAVDFDISYQNSEYLELTGSQNRNGGTMANNEFRWLADNAHKYGFIWRYKIDGSDVSAGGNYTGTISEGWHWRFAGVYHATKFWEKCASDTDGDGLYDTGYMTNDNYIWEDYYYENIAGNSKYPQSEYEAFTEFYNSEKGNRCSYQEYKNMIN